MAHWTHLAGSKSGKASGAQAWQPLKRATAIPKTQEQYEALAAEWRAKGNPKATWRQIEQDLTHADLWGNDKYLVDRRDCGPDPDGGRLIWLSIKRHDRAPIHDWRDLQRIKSQLCGPEAEGVELYPAESRVVDTANQYHLWVFTKSKIGFGFKQGEKMTPEEAARVGAKQRDGA